MIQVNGRTRRGFGAAVGSAALLMLSTGACGPIPESSEPLETLSTQDQELETDNGIAFNGLAFNGLAFNGLAFNGLAFNGLNSASFSTWFEQNTALSSTVMKYLVACAVPAQQARTYTDARGKVYLWQGSLGLAPGWANGAPATVVEQQLISSCLAAHVNKFGRTVPISVLGRSATGVPIPTPTQELQEFSQREGCFFGNLFTNEGVFAGNDDGQLRWWESSVRACALGKDSEGCSAIPQVGSCASRCTLDATGTYYTQCTYNGTTYAPITTRMRPQDIYACGDGKCQFTESGGLGVSTHQCLPDCGLR